jgi:hypothetical protein
MNSLDLTGLSRFTGFSVSSEGTYTNGIAETGKQYAIYMFHGTTDSDWGCSFLPEPGDYIDTLTINDVPAASYLLEWIDPAKGAMKRSESISFEGGDIMLVTPPYVLDIALRMLKQE